jgi:hypothetical protein
MSDEASDFAAKGYAVVRGFLAPEDVTVVSQYMEYALKNGIYADRGETSKVKENNPSRFYRYADPMAEVMLVNSRDAVSNIAGKALLPTYSFSRVYISGDELSRHVDRPSCEYSVTLNIGCDGEPWPVWMQDGDNTPVKLLLNPGDAIVYKGCEIHHWRNKMVGCKANAQMMLHYVEENGPFADYHWDKRIGAGFPDIWS